MSKGKIEKMQEAVNIVTQTEFSQKYKKHKEAIEGKMEEFFLNKELFEKEDQQHIQTNYGEVVDKFDAALEQIKSCFADPTVRKAFLNKPDIYTNAIEAHLDYGYKHFSNEIGRRVDRVTHNQSGTLGLTEIALIIGLVKELYDVYKEHKKAYNEMSVEFFESQYVKPLRLKRWEEYSH